MKDFNKSACGQDVVRAAMTQLLLYYTRFLELVKRAGPRQDGPPEGAVLARNAVTVPSMMYEIKRYTRS